MTLPIDEVEPDGELLAPDGSAGLVVFSHGSRSRGLGGRERVAELAAEWFGTHLYSWPSWLLLRPCSVSENARGSLESLVPGVSEPQSVTLHPFSGGPMSVSNTASRDACLEERSLSTPPCRIDSTSEPSSTHQSLGGVPH